MRYQTAIELGILVQTLLLFACDRPLATAPPPKRPAPTQPESIAESSPPIEMAHDAPVLLTLRPRPGLRYQMAMQVDGESNTMDYRIVQRGPLVAESEAGGGMQLVWKPGYAEAFKTDGPVQLTPARMPVDDVVGLISPEGHWTKWQRATPDEVDGVMAMFSQAFDGEHRPNQLRVGASHQDSFDITAEFRSMVSEMFEHEEVAVHAARAERETRMVGVEGGQTLGNVAPKRFAYPRLLRSERSSMRSKKEGTWRTAWFSSEAPPGGSLDQ